VCGPRIAYDGFEPGQLGLKVEPQLRAFFFRQATGHLRKDGAIERRAVGVPGHRFGSAHLRQNCVEFRANLVEIGIPGGRLALLGSVVVPKQVALAGRGRLRLMSSGPSCPRSSRASTPFNRTVIKARWGGRNKFGHDGPVAESANDA
jgi:hypothetical protein